MGRLCWASATAGWEDVTPRIDMGRGWGWRQMRAEADRVASGQADSTVPWRVRMALGGGVGHTDRRQRAAPLRTERTTAFGRVESGYEYGPRPPRGDPRHPRGACGGTTNRLPHSALRRRPLERLTSAKNGMHRSHASKAEASPRAVRLAAWESPATPDAPTGARSTAALAGSARGRALFRRSSSSRDIERLLEEKRPSHLPGAARDREDVCRAGAGGVPGAGRRERVRLVQFHPSYAYEDFVQGYRP